MPDNHIRLPLAPQHAKEVDAEAQGRYNVEVVGTLRQLTALTGRLMGAPRVFTGTGKYVPSTNCKAIYVELVGGGGGGGGATFSSPNGAVGGGGAGGSLIGKYLEVNPSIQYSYSVGAGGAGGSSAGAAGGNGTSTTFSGGNVSLTACGGGGGNGMTAGTSVLATAGGVRLGTSIGGDIRVDGGPGHHGIRTSGTTGLSGAGGNSPLGGGGGEKGSTGAGQVGGAYGGGGGGAVAFSASSAGGAGGAGTLIIWEFA